MPPVLPPRRAGHPPPLPTPTLLTPSTPALRTRDPALPGHCPPRPCPIKDRRADPPPPFWDGGERRPCGLDSSSLVASRRLGAQNVVENCTTTRAQSSWSQPVLTGPEPVVRRPFLGCRKNFRGQVGVCSRLYVTAVALAFRRRRDFISISRGESEATHRVRGRRAGSSLQRVGLSWARNPLIGNSSESVARRTNRLLPNQTHAGSLAASRQSAGCGAESRRAGANSLLRRVCAVRRPGGPARGWAGRRRDTRVDTFKAPQTSEQHLFLRAMEGICMGMGEKQSGIGPAATALAVASRPDGFSFSTRIACNCRILLGCIQLPRFG